MNRLTSIVAVSFIALTSVAGIATAAQRATVSEDMNKAIEMTPDAPSMRPAHSFKMAEADKMTAWKSGTIDVETLSEQNKDMNDQLKAVTPAQIEMIASQLTANPALVSALKQMNVQINNIVAIEEFADGGVTVYVR